MGSNVSLQIKPGPLKAPKFIYRYLADEEHATQMLAGRVWISTFEHIRTVDSARADPDEGKVQYTVSQLSHETPEDEARLIRQRLKNLKAFSGPSSGFVLNDCIVRSTFPDAYLFCTSLAGVSRRLRASFGQYCIRIAEPGRFFMAVTEVLKGDSGFAQVAFAPVNYQGREFADAQKSVGSPYFANVAGNRDEREARMCWVPVDNPKIEPRIVEVPQIAHLMSIV